MLDRNKYFVMDSESAANQLAELFNLKERVFVVPPLVKQLGKSVASKKKQILIVNTLEPRKRTQNAIDGFLFAKNSKLIDPEWKLRIAGSHGWLQDRLLEDLKEKRFGEDVLYSELPTDSLLSRLYDESEIVLSISAAEGFGLPPLEGMHFGCLPVVSKIPTHVEHVNKNGVFIEGIKPEEIALGLKSAIEILDNRGQEVREELRRYVKEKFGEDILIEKWATTLQTIYNLHNGRKI